MNTGELYIEPVIIGVLVLVMLALPFAPEVWGLIAQLAAIKLPAGIVLGAILVGAAYLVGILADRLVDSALEALERHNRVRFACRMLRDWGERQWRNMEWNDPYPEDLYRWRVMIDAERISEFLDYVRSRVRLLRSLAYLLPGLLYGATVGVLRAQHLHECTGNNIVQSPNWCSAMRGFIWTLPEMSHQIWWFWLAPVVCAYLAIWPLSLLARRFDRGNAELRDGDSPQGSAAGNRGNVEIRDGDSSQGSAADRSGRPIEFSPPEGRFCWTKSRRFSPRRAGRWRPPRTYQHKEMRIYAADRDWIAGGTANYRLFGDIALQPFTLVATFLVLYAASVAGRGPDPAGMFIAIGVGALLVLATGWAWWRTTNTFMAYLQGPGRYLSDRKS